MVGERNTPLDERNSITLKFSELEVDFDNPWTDDLLARQSIATQLTNLVATQEWPLAISLDGQWGTGKTFLLRRWQKQLEKTRVKAIYFNAWEDDFCDDPLLAIIGQLSDYFKLGRLKTIARQAAQIAMPLIKENVVGVLKATTGVTIKADQQKQGNKSFLDAYLEQRATKDKLKGQLAKLSERVVEETSHPMVFIIDELDRCRPTFAIELLERVKHIFDVPHMVFVFGLNRDELSKSLLSVYGEINTDVYLRRFFDFEFTLPESDSQRFAEHLIDKFQLGQVFLSLSREAGVPGVWDEYDYYRRVFPKLWSALGLSLRDIDYAVRLLALLARTVPVGALTHPYFLGILISMKFKKAEFYQSLVTGDFRTSEIMDYIDGELRKGLMDDDFTGYLDRSEGLLYCADNTNLKFQPSGEAALVELSSVLNGNPGIPLLVISQRAQNADQPQLNEIIQAIRYGRQLHIDGKVLGNLAALIDTYQTQLRR